MENQDKRTEGQADEGKPDGATTGVGQVVQSLARVTRQLPAAQERRAAMNVATAAQRERIAILVSALGEPSHPLHPRAVDDLVTLGAAAVPALNEALRPNRPWLTAFRAAEALGQIGDGRAAGPLLDALRHPNSNVRWSAVRALSTVGDARALLDLRRVARDDRGKTSWGEPVAGAAQSALDQMQGSNMLLRGADLVKTAVACVLMLVSLIVAWSVVTSLREELSSIGQVDAAAVPLVRTAPPLPTSAPTLPPLPTAAAQPTPLPATIVPAAVPLIGAVTTPGNVRATPARADNNVIGAVSEGDEIIFLATTPDQQWYRIQLGDRRGPGSRIDGPDGSGWVARSLLTEPPVDVPVEEPPLPTATPSP
jgi:hypothetical protein